MLQPIANVPAVLMGPQFSRFLVEGAKQIEETVISFLNYKKIVMLVM